MIALIDTTAAGGCERAMRGMFAARKQVFVDLLGWQVPVLEGQYEIDQFDNADARYLIVTDGGEHHLASARLLPTTRPHILDSLFPALCAAPVPRGPDTFEITRFCLDRNITAAQRRDARNRLVSALVVHALATGVRTYTGVADSAWLAQILQFGWDASPLGQIMTDSYGSLGALRINIDGATPSRLQATGMWIQTHSMQAETAAA
ncbi:acyl-homoserine-lactone synthase [Sphingomonas canadensis]|uniref:Acyl-homoserine-lactone synthase n=1 Tax=Sphingomonas canadensis TaxID=1219257 RepID=A0ABW3HCV0_9SPHN|nr:acyl-homoserine-lactone synthase [Sphingomonas canadensis]MCW3838188.1 autoinducer synthase [Sphingomonas canadensis]